MAANIRGPLHNSSAPDEPKQVDKLLKWQKDRIERKLRGEYESAVLHLSHLINENIHTPLILSAVRVEGASNTRKSFLASIIDPVVSSRPTDLEGVLHATRRISEGLRKTDIFASLDAYIDRPKDPLSESPDAIDLVFRTKERGRWYVSSSTELGNSEGSANATTRIRNIFGGAETFEASLSMGTKTKRAFRGTLTAPLTSDMNTRLVSEVYAQERDLTSYASCWEGLKGIRALIRRGEADQGFGMHEFAYDAVFRNITALSPTASISMRESAGPSTKCSISHTWLYDTRDDRIAATKGVYLKLFQEIAGASIDENAGIGLRGDSKFYKTEAEAQLSRGLSKGISLSFALRGGLLWGLPSFKEESSPKTLFSDRFQLGGPTSIRSFKANGMGPRDGEDSIGGQVYYSAGASIVSDVPTKPHWPLKLHAWANAGRLDGVDQSRLLSQTLAQTLSKPSISAGVGIIYRFDPVRVEVNFGVPVVKSESDKTSRGVQVGMGLEFM